MFRELEETYRGLLIWDDNTILLYIFIILMGTGLAKLSTYNKVNSQLKISYNQFYIYSFLIFLFFLIFRDVGTDLQMYKTIYNNCELDSSIFNNQEPGFLLLNRLLKWFDFSDTFVIGIWGGITLILYFSTIHFFSSKINVSLSIFAFGCLFYFQSFNLVRIYLASGILIYASKYLFNNELKKYLLIILLTVFIHFSAILAVIPLIFYWLYKLNHRLFYCIYFLSYLCGFVLTNFLSSIPIFARYDEYLSGGMIKGGIGFFQITINIPLLLLYYYSKNKINNTRILSIFLIYTLSSLFIGILSYRIMMLGRSLVYYNIIYIICVPYVLKGLKNYGDKNERLICTCFYIYFMWRFYQYLKEYLYFDSIMPYKFIDI